MGDSGLYAVMPVKSFASAKQRMATYLTPSQRQGLARCMFQDVLDAARRARRLRGILAVTADAEAQSIARAAGAEILLEGADVGYAAAVSAAAGRLHLLHADGMIVIPSDIPHLKPATIDEIAEVTPARGVTILPANHDGGTNLLCMRPFDLIKPLFGLDSCARHLSAARKAGVEPVILRRRDEGRDLDRPADLAPFLQLESATRSHRFLSALRLGEQRIGPLPNVALPVAGEAVVPA